MALIKDLTGDSLIKGLFAEELRRREPRQQWEEKPLLSLARGGCPAGLTQSSGYGRGPWAGAGAPGGGMKRVAETEAQQGGSGGKKYPFPPFSSVESSPPTGHVQMADFSLPGDNGQTYNRVKLTQLNDERHISVGNILRTSPWAKNFACITSFQP